MVLEFIYYSWALSNNGYRLKERPVASNYLAILVSRKLEEIEAIKKYIRVVICVHQKGTSAGVIQSPHFSSFHMTANRCQHLFFCKTRTDLTHSSRSSHGRMSRETVKCLVPCSSVHLVGLLHLFGSNW